MALEIKFNIPAASVGQEPAFRILWYQSSDGQVWDVSPIDTELVSNLTIDTDGKYIWNSAAPDATRWSMIKTEDQYGVDSDTGLTFPPALLPTTDYGAVKVSDGQAVYKVGSVIDLMLKLDADDAISAGDSLAVQIKDIFGNLIGSTTAERIGTNLYAAEYTIPSNLDALYNTLSADESELDTAYYYLKDTWLFPNATQVEFDIAVSRSSAEQPVDDNMLYIISIDGLNNSFINETVNFTSPLTTYYASVDDVISVTGATSVGDFDVARQVMLVSEHVDLHMKPNVIQNLPAYNSAVRCYVRMQAAINLMGDDLRLDGESKKLDTFQITKQYNSNLYDDLQDKARQCALIIWAGGLDTPFKPQRFQKGLYDPNRPNFSRANLDVSGNMPWVNTTSKPILMLDGDGRAVELRGIRTISLPSAGNRLL